MTEERTDVAERKAKLERAMAEMAENAEPSLPLASVVAVTELMDIPARGCTRALATVMTGGGTRYVSVPRDAFHEGDVCVLFVTNACVKREPVYEKWRDVQSIDVDFNLNEFGVKVSYLAFKGPKQYFRLNPGILIPVSELPSVAERCVGEDVSGALGVCLHDDIIRRERDRLVAERAEKRLDDERNQLKAKYYRARDWRAHSVEKTIGKAPPFVKVSRFDSLADHPEYFELYRDTLFDVTEKYNGLNLTVYYSPDTDGKVHVCRNGMELAPDSKSYFWNVIRQQGVDRELKDMGYAVSLEGVVTGPSIRGGVFDGRGQERFCIYDIYDLDEGRILCPSERYSYCREADIAHVQLVARDFPLFQKALSLQPLLASAARPNTKGGVRYGLVFRASGDDDDLAFQLPNPNYRPSAQQLEVDSHFEAE